MFPCENATGLWFENTWVPLKKVLGSSKNHVQCTRARTEISNKSESEMYWKLSYKISLAQMKGSGSFGGSSSKCSNFVLIGLRCHDFWVNFTIFG